MTVEDESKKAQKQQMDEMLKSAGIPRYVVSTTLLKEKKPEVRKIIEDQYGTIGGKNGITCLAVYSDMSPKSQKLFDVICKEICLCGFKSLYIYQQDFLDELNSMSYQQRSKYYTEYNLLFIPDLELANDTRFTQKEIDRIDVHLAYMIKNNRGVCVHLDKSVRTTGGIRGDKIMKLISYHAVEITL